MQSTPTIASKFPNVSTSIFSIMSVWAQEHQAVNLAQGFPDFDCHPELVRLAHHYMQKGMNQYAPSAGILPLRERIAEKTAHCYGFSPNPATEITLTAGATEALFLTISALVNSGDEVIIFEPAYDSYIPVIELNGGKAVPITLEENTYAINWDKVKEALTPQTKMIIINTPHNPSGSVLKPHDITELTQIVLNNDLFLVSDEVYEHIIFDGATHQSMLLYPVLRERSIVISSFGKTFHNTGWKMGYVVAPDSITAELRKLHQYVTFSCFAPAQYALADFMENKEHYTSLPNFYQERRDKFRELMQATDFELLPCEGTYFQLVSYAHLSNEPDVDYAKRIAKEAGVATIPTSPFYTNKLDRKVIRFCFAKQSETMEQAVELLVKNAKALRG